MKHIAGNYFRRFVVTGVLSVLVALPFNSSLAEGETVGADEYRNSCLTCHGVGGRGNGPLAQHLLVKPSDLTQIAKNNYGEFPFLKIIHAIDGRMTIKLHGAASMPVWGSRYKVEAGNTFGPFGAETYIRGRILSLAYYLESIQEK